MKKRSPDNGAINLVESTCPVCNSRNISTVIQQQRFTYGEETEAVGLEADVPVRNCNTCRYQFTDHVAEEIKHDAVCRHLGVMSPKEIRRLREKYGLTRADFAGLTRIGEASLARWETGILIQNYAYDQFLYLLLFSENKERLEKRNFCGGSNTKIVENLLDGNLEDDPCDDRPRFVALSRQEVKTQEMYARVFELRRAGSTNR